MPSAQDQILNLLKSRGPQGAGAVATQLGITVQGARKHLNGLSESGLLEHFDLGGTVGRPRRQWRLTEKAEARFPDSHSFLTLELIEAVRDLQGEEGLDRLILQREDAIRQRYARQLQGESGLQRKVARLAKLRSDEGYMAEWQALPGGALLFIENHCPICAAARACQGFCRSELDIFRQVLGPSVTIERVDHIVAGARRCAYNIEKRP